jgi:hypothetical protein
MASRDEKGSDKGRVKVRVIEFEMEGNNQTLRDSIRDIVGAIGKSAIVGRQNDPARLQKSQSSNPGNAETLPDNGDPDPIEIIEEDDAPSESRQPRKRTIKSPEILNLDLMSGNTPLKSFLEKLKPEGDNLRYLAVSYWFKNFFSTNEINPNHAHTAYRLMGWATPTEAGQPFRTLKHRKFGYFGKGAEVGAYAINHVGENKINEMLKSAPNAS